MPTDFSRSETDGATPRGAASVATQTTDAAPCEGCSGDSRFYLAEHEHVALIGETPLITEFGPGWTAIPCPWCRNLSDRDTVLANIGDLIEHRREHDLPWIVGS